MLSSQEEMKLYKHSTDSFFKEWNTREKKKKNHKQNPNKVILKVICGNPQGGVILYSVRLRKIYVIS